MDTFPTVVKTIPTTGVTRREFTLLTALTALAGVTITVAGTGCGSSAGSPNSPSSVPAGSVNGLISANHGHQAVITTVEMADDGAVSLNIQYQADHNHVVSLAPADITSIAGGGTVTVQSTETQAHSHSVTFAKSNQLPAGNGY